MSICKISVKKDGEKYKYIEENVKWKWETCSKITIDLLYSNIKFSLEQKQTI